jgi:polysaccharide pyruvyl transferase WcaK-like protein
VRSTFLVLLSLAGVRVARLGVSFGRMSAVRLKLEAFVSRFYAFSGARDTRSLALARRSGFSNVGYCPDFAFALPPPGRIWNKHPNVLQIGVSLREDNLGVDRRALTVRRLDQLLATLRDEGRKFVVRFIAQVDADRTFMKELSERFGDRYECTFIAEQRLSSLAHIYYSIDLIVSNRLHSLLFAGAQGAVPFGLLIPDCNQKIIAILDDLGLGEHWINAETSDDVRIDVCRLQEKANTVSAAFGQSAKLITDRVEALLAS